MYRSITLSTFLVFCVLQSSINAAVTPSPYNAFYVFAGDHIHIIEPESRTLVGTITNITTPGLCVKGGSSNACRFTDARVINGQMYGSDYYGSAIKIIDLKTQKVIERIPTDTTPRYMYDVHWYNEIWVHSWTLSTFAVVKTDKRILTHKAVRAHTTPGWTHGDMLADEKLWEGQYGYVSHFGNDGIHKVNLVDKSYAGYVNLSAYNCTGTWRMGYSTYNQRVYVDCRRNRRELRTLEMDPTTDRVTRVFQFPGNPHVSPNGRFVVSVYNRYGVSSINILALSGSDATHYPQLSFNAEGATDVVFYPKSTNPDSYNAFVTFQNTNRMAVIDLDLASDNNNNAVKYINDVGEVDTTRRRRSRKLFINGKWIISVASKSNEAVIVDAETHKVHGKIPNVDTGDLVLWVNSGSSGPKSFVVMTWLCLLLKFFF